MSVMKKYFGMLAVLSGLFIFSHAKAQFTKAPDAVKQAFQQQYPNATDVDYSNVLLETDVTFKDSGAVCKARYTNEGKWQATSRKISFETLSREVQDGFNKSKYADWKVDDVYEIYQPGKDMEYKVQVEKNTVQKKNLFFNTRGKMLRDNITI
jgi:hypothetical protein